MRVDDGILFMAALEEVPQGWRDLHGQPFRRDELSGGVQPGQPTRSRAGVPSRPSSGENTDGSRGPRRAALFTLVVVVVVVVVIVVVVVVVVVLVVVVVV